MGNDTEKDNIDNDRKTEDEGWFMWEEQQLRRNEGYKRHKKTEIADIMWVKMVLGTSWGG